MSNKKGVCRSHNSSLILKSNTLIAKKDFSLPLFFYLIYVSMVISFNIVTAYEYVADDMGTFALSLSE